jgi:uncharacterized protein DUF4760
MAGVQWTLLGLVIAIAAFVTWGFYLPLETLQEAARLAPLGTAAIALAAAVIALSAMYVQRDTAKRRAAIDFFLKTEMDEKLIEAWTRFQELTPKIPSMISRPEIKVTDQDFRELTKWLNICELIATAVNLDAFSERVSRHYWEYVLPDSFFDARLFIMHMRGTPKLGGPKTYIELQKLAERWGDQRRASGSIPPPVHVQSQEVPNQNPSQPSS